MFILSLQNWIYSYLSRGVYINQINEFLNYFPLKNFQFILSQDFYEHPIAICNKIFNFLNVKNYSFLQPRHLNKGQYQYQIDQRLLDYLKCNFEKPNNELSKLLKLDLKFNEF
jgi:hypothetical protein